MTRLQNLVGLVTKYLGLMNLSPEHSEDGLYLFKYGSTVVMISLFEEADDTFVRFASVMLKDFEPSLELLQRILRLNTEVLFGSFLLFEDNTLSFSATLLGNHLDFDYDPGKGMRSEHDYGVVCQLIEHGWSDSRIVRAFEDHPQGIGAKFSKAGYRYLERTIRKAHQAVGR